jgi:hypothetical protein
MLAIVRVIVATLPAAIHGTTPPAAQHPAGLAADVVWIWLQALPTDGPDGLDAAYDRLQLRAEGRVLGFQVHLEKDAVRVVAVNGGLDGLAERPEVEIELPHPHSRVPKRRSPAAPGRQVP